MAPSRIAYFTAGNAGVGHLVRGLTVRRALERQGIRAEYRMFGPRLPFALAQRDDYQPVPIVEAELRSPALASAGLLAEALRAFAPDVLLVDCYWAPLRHVLPLARCEAWLLARWLPPRWFLGPPDSPWEPRQYRRVIRIEPCDTPGVTDTLPPLVISNPDEARPKGALRAHLKVRDGERLSLVAHAGLPGEAASLAARAGEGYVVLSLHDANALFPLAEWLGDADEVFTAAGYNSYWEARWMGTEPRTRFCVLDRQRPEQQWRLSTCAEEPMRENGADRLARMLS